MGKSAYLLYHTIAVPAENPASDPRLQRYIPLTQFMTRYRYTGRVW